ncbi:unnamed protein product [Rhodiola kirilowii]
MHLGLLAAAAHAAATNSRFSIFYNPRASPSEFVIPLAKLLRRCTTLEYLLACASACCLRLKNQVLGVIWAQ